MGDLFVGGKALWLAPLSLLVFGAAFGLIPGLLLRGIVLFYPKDDPRRQELFGELYAPEMGRFERYVWVFQQLETALRDGLQARRDVRQQRKETRNLLQQLPTLHPLVNRRDASIAAAAFASLPEEWRSVLWYTEVENETPAKIAPLLGLQPNGVAVLAYRAREGLRQAYLRAHLNDVEPESDA